MVQAVRTASREGSVSPQHGIPRDRQMGRGAQALAPGPLISGTPVPQARSVVLPSPLFFRLALARAVGVSCLCQPASRHGELARSRSLLPNLSANEEANAWDGCGAGRSELSQPDGPAARPVALSSSHLSRVLSDVLGCKEGLGMRCSVEILCPDWYHQLKND